MPKLACIFTKFVSRPNATSQPCLRHEALLLIGGHTELCLHLHKGFEHIRCSFLASSVAHGSVSVCTHYHAQSPDHCPRLSAFLAEWDESRRNHSIRSAQVSYVNTEIWNKVQTARVTVAFYEGSMLQTHTRSFQGINGMISMRGLRQMDLHFAEHQG